LHPEVQSAPVIGSARFLLLASVSLLALLGLDAAQTHASPKGAKPSARKVGASSKASNATKGGSLLLWKLESTSAKVYVLGSIHAANDGLYPLDGRILSAFEEADTLVLETDLTPTAKLRGARLMQVAGSLPAQKRLEEQLDPDTRAQLARVLEELGIPASAVSSLRPWLVSLVLTMQKLESLGYRADLGIDEHFRSRAMRKQVAALESVEEQVALFRDLPSEAQLASLKQTLEQLPQLSATMQRAVQAWKRGDAQSLDALLLEPMRRGFPSLFERFFLERNRKMAQAVRRYLEGHGTVFMVVGSGHLIGDQSVLHFLEKMGHPASQL
jgi:uncharacterized protein YbaP (TraB family)